ncbi:MAG: CBS domain-containing protein [Pirellulaceae bacterium]
MQTTELVAQKLEAKVSSAMTSDVEAVLASATVGEVADRMLDEGVHRIIVVDKQNCVLGVVSQRDVLRQYLATQERSPVSTEVAFETIEIGSLINRDRPLTVTADVPLTNAAMVLAANKIGCLPVVGFHGDLLGVLTTSDVLRHITGGVSVRLESSFQMYSVTQETKVKLPAYIRKSSGELVIPLKSMEKPEARTKYVVLGYDPPSGRILVKFAGDEPGVESAMLTRVDDGCLVVASSGFVTHYNLAGKTSAFELSSHKDNRYIVLSPRQTN